VQGRVRTRDPERRSRILEAAADLVGRKGFHAVSIAEIGAAAGITGSGVYRHFDSKSAVLVALFDRVIDDLLREEQEILATTSDLGQALDLLIAGQVEFVVGDRQLAQVYYNEINNLPEEDRRRLRRKQRLYLEEWVHLVNELGGDVSDSDARAVVHAVIGAIQSPLFHNTGLAEDRLRALLTRAARAILGIAG
jgi:AcrR family transcriptional regulator